MPNIKSAKKRLKTSVKAHDRNRAVKSEVSSTRRRLFEAIAGGDSKAAQDIFRVYCSQLDKAVKKGMMKRNNASRRKSRTTARLTAM